MTYKTKYYPLSDKEAMNKDINYFKAFGYQMKEPKILESRNAIEIKFFRDDSLEENQMYAEYEEIYSEAEDGLAYIDSYYSYRPSMEEMKSSNKGLRILAVLLGLYLSLCTIVFSAFAIMVLFFPEIFYNIGMFEEGKMVMEFSEGVVILGLKGLDVKAFGILIAIIAVGFLFIVILIFSLLAKSKKMREVYYEAEQDRYEQRLSLLKKNRDAMLSDIQFIKNKLGIE